MARLPDRSNILWLCGLLLSTAYLSASSTTSFAFDRPIRTATAVFLFAGLALVLTPFERLGPAKASSHHEKGRDESPSPYPDRQILPVRRHRLLLGLLVGAICARVEVYRRIVDDVQCAVQSWEPLVPLFIAFYEHWQPSRNRSRTLSNASHKMPNGSGSRPSSKTGRRTYVVPVALISFIGLYLCSLTREPQSTYVCAHAKTFRTLIPLLQFLAIPLDTLIILLTDQLSFKGPDNVQQRSTKRPAAPLGLALIMSSFILALAALFRKPDDNASQWHRFLAFRMTSKQILGAMNMALGGSVVSVFSFRLAIWAGPSCASVAILATCIYTSTLSFAAEHPQAYPPVSFPLVIFLLASMFMILACYRWANARTDTTSERPRRPGIMRPTTSSLLCILFLLALQFYFWISRSHSVGYIHPIQTLIEEAEDQHEAWLAQGASSWSVHEAAKTYSYRYGRDPPPRFKRWYDFAVLKESVIIDDFDQINEDVAPFWALEPAEIRYRTWEAISHPDNGIGAIIIRNGRAEVGGFTPGSHRWMLDEVINMMSSFVAWLPDMDLAFNINDESRVTVPFADMARLRRDSMDNVHTGGQQDFEPSRGHFWKPIPEEPIPETRFHVRSSSHVFHDFGSIGCPPSSKARSERHWDLSSTCTSCMYPHSYHQFVSNWTLSGSPCHQPDLADFHGLYLSPAAFWTSTDLMPIFSQSKAHGFNDILHPSPWNYQEKTKYAPNNDFPDPTFADKDPTLFWLGATTEGNSCGNGRWRGMSRQRLVHLFNNATKSERQLVLLPSSPVSNTVPSNLTITNNETSTGQLEQSSAKYTYQSLPPSTLHAHLSTNIRIVDHIERCCFADCSDQAAEFSPSTVPFVDFQSHWRYKYLMDMDGAGFSGRFIPFLQSKSLPFKVSLMREWWEGRVRGWVHFVPVDLRLGETWSILAWAAGWKDLSPRIKSWKPSALGRPPVAGKKKKKKGSEGGVVKHELIDEIQSSILEAAGEEPKKEEEEEERWLMPPHDSEAEKIALQGREWANRALRREDMEVYLFRLLLEWGRVTDDRRDQLGWAG